MYQMTVETANNIITLIVVVVLIVPCLRLTWEEFNRPMK